MDAIMPGAVGFLAPRALGKTVGIFKHYLVNARFLERYIGYFMWLLVVCVGSFSFVEEL